MDRLATKEHHKDLKTPGSDRWANESEHLR